MKVELKDPSAYVEVRPGTAELTIRATDMNLEGFLSKVGAMLLDLKSREAIALHGINSENWKDLLSKPEFSKYVKHGSSESIVAFSERTGLVPFLKEVRAENLVMVVGPLHNPIAHIENTLKTAGKWWKLQPVDSVKLWLKNLPSNCVLIFLSLDHLSVEFYGDTSMIQALYKPTRN